MYSTGWYVTCASVIDENCQNSPADCPCGPGYKCNPALNDPYAIGGCVYSTGTCGNGICDNPKYGTNSNEYCDTCPQDCGCDKQGLYESYPICSPADPNANGYGCIAGTPPGGGGTGTAKGLTVEITTDKESYMIGETVYCTIKVKDSATGATVPSANLRLVATHVNSGRSKESTGTTNPAGESSMSFIWGKDDTGKVIKEGKLRLDVTASKTGYSDGTASKLVSGCGDLECAPTEDCVDCEEDCNCSATGGVCDPSSEYRDQKTLCAPKMAYVFVSKGLSSYHLWWTTDDQELIKKRYASLGYTVAPTMEVDHINDIATYLSRPSMRAIAYFGHGEDPAPGVKAIPMIETAEAIKGGYSIKSALASMTNASKGYKYTCQYETYMSKFTGANKDKINQIANERIESPILDYAFLFACYSFEDSSLMDYLVRSGGMFWGYKGKLPGNADLTPALKI